ncbi:MAG TPA: hypothetical protein VIM79_26450 [Niastella sp.]
MQKLILGITAMLMAVTACKKDSDQKNFNAKDTHAGPYAGVVILPEIIDADRELSADSLYILDGKTTVCNCATLVIPEGTRIEALKQPNNEDASALIITRCSKLYAVGTVDRPIVFTSGETTPNTGDWGGIVLLGYAPLNVPDQLIEGVNPAHFPPGTDLMYGGGGAGLGDPHDSSGELTFLRIEYAGVAIAVDNTLNGLSLGGVGDGTVLDYIEVAKSNTEGFQFFGGTVNAKHLFSFSSDDEAFDFSIGYNGKIQFALSMLDINDNFSANPNGVESENTPVGAANTPVSTPIISNMTIMGVCDSLTSRTLFLLSSVSLRRSTNYVIRNSVFFGYPTGVRFTGVSTANFQYNTVHGFQAASGGMIDATNTAFTGALPFSCTPFQYFPGTTYFPPGTDLTPVSYRGAFDGTNNWLDGWARLNY